MDIGNGPGGGGLTYQDEKSEEVPVKEKETHVQTRVRRLERVVLDAAVVEGIRKRRKVVADAHERDDDDDDTMEQYCAGDEQTRTSHGIPAFRVDDDE